MLDRPAFTAVAWVPWSWDRDEVMAAHPLAIEWAIAQAAQAGTRPVLRVHSHAHDWIRSTTYSRYAKLANVVTDRGHRANGPTLVPVAHSMELVASGMSCARGYAIVVEEHPALPLAAWAAELGALNLRTGKQTADPREPELADRVRSLASSLYNGWGSLPGSSAAKHRMSELAAVGTTWADFVGTLLAVAPNHVDEKGMLRWTPQAWKEEIAARMDRNSDPSRWA